MFDQYNAWVCTPLDTIAGVLNGGCLGDRSPSSSRAHKPRTQDPGPGLSECAPEPDRLRIGCHTRHRGYFFSLQKIEKNEFDDNNNKLIKQYKQLIIKTNILKQMVPPGSARPRSTPRGIIIAIQRTDPVRATLSPPGGRGTSSRPPATARPSPHPRNSPRPSRPRPAGQLGPR